MFIIVGKQIQEIDKGKKELLDWFLAETDELADLVYDSSTNGKPTDTALAKKVRSRLEAYCAFQRGKTKRPHSPVGKLSPKFLPNFWRISGNSFGLC